MKNILVTGGCGFIGSNFIRLINKTYKNINIYIVDSLTYAGDIRNIPIPENGNTLFMYQRNIAEDWFKDILEEKEIDTIVNFAAESHNSYAIINPTIFFKTNTMGVQNLLEAVRNCKRKNEIRFHQVSTCEVFGDMELDSLDSFTESSPHNPTTPYSASKAAADMIVQAYHKTYGIDTTTSICCNNFGPYQFPEKLIPLTICNVLQNKPVVLYKHSEYRRQWIHVEDHCLAILKILEKGISGGKYNVSTPVEKSVEDIVNHILILMGKEEYPKQYIADRPQHDKRYYLSYSLNTAYLKWQPTKKFNEALIETVNWYKENDWWWKPLIGKSPVNEENWNKNLQTLYTTQERVNQ